MRNTLFLRWAAFLGAAAVASGAFGAHGLKPHFSEYQVSLFEKGVQYHFIHALAILAIGLLSDRKGGLWLRVSGWLFSLGILFFSGSLYLLACQNLLPFSVKGIEFAAPVGGICFIGGWLVMAMGIRR
ncbi:MAG: DUF423 domain-containing protein [Saprospiraceae bacterium]|nr:DUF423 domain-containing protein [Saprospiraceae bacterium]MDW8483971.1 DUF423 domain-containing protein [Saprospiraceae bacterium]